MGTKVYLVIDGIVVKSLDISNESNQLKSLKKVYITQMNII